MLVAAPAGAPAPEVTRRPQPPTQMAPGQVPQPPPWGDANPFYLLSPLMGLLSRAWSRLRGPGPLKAWLEEAGTGADEGDACLEEATKAALATHYAPWGGRPPWGPGDSGRAVEDARLFWGACPDPKANSFLLEAWELSDDDDDEEEEEDDGGEDSASIPKEEGGDHVGGQPAPWSLSLLRTPQDPRVEEETEEGGVAEDKGITFFSSRPSRWEGCPGMEEQEEEGEAVTKVPRTSTSPSSPGSQPSAWVCAAGEEEPGAKEEGRTEKKESRKASISSSSADSHPSAWECDSGEESEEDEKAEKEADPEPHPSVVSHRPWHQPKEEEEEGSASGEAEGLPAIPTTSAFMKAWVCWPGEDTEEEDEDSDSGAAEEEGEAEGLPTIPTTSAFLRAWVYQPGEDTEEEEEDSDSGAAEEEGEAEGPSSIPPASAFLRAWVYRPGEDTEEENEDEEDDSETAEEEGEAEGPSSIPPASAYLRAWVYRPGEDTEEEDEDEEDDSETAGSGPSPSLQAQSALLRDWTCPPGNETEGVEAAEEAEPFRVAIYLPGEKPPPPWPLPRLPLQLRRRLKSAGTPAQHPDPETPQKARKVRFSEKVSVHFLVVWAGPAQAARTGPWEQFARDRSRFARRIAQAQEKLGPCLTPEARARAWARLGNPPSYLAATPAATQASPASSVQATPLSHTGASPSPLYVSPSPALDLSGRRG